jgi:hypothetical protein
LAQETINEEELDAIMEGTFLPQSKDTQYVESSNSIKLKPVIETI